ncbi:MAG: adenine phosphoribosyltransferase [Acidobacteriota bacterium]
MDLKDFIRDVPDFPKPGIVFKDITPLLRSPKALEYVSEALAAPFRDAGVTSVVAIESRGFIFGTGVARVLNAGLVPVRKPGKLPWKTRTFEYTLEYGSGALEIHDDALTADDRALIVDDVLATGGTAAAAACLVRDLGATIVGIGMVIELLFLKGREKLDGTVVHSLLKY